MTAACGAGGPLLLVTVDAEEEWDWTSEFPIAPFSTKNIQRLPDFQRLCSDIGLRPTYFVDQAVVDEPVNREIIGHYLGRDECDVGAQLHPWCTPPVEESLSEANSHSINLPGALVESKIRG